MSDTPAHRIIFTGADGVEHDVTKAVEFDLKPGAADQIAAERRPLKRPDPITLDIQIDPETAARFRHQLAKPNLWRQPTAFERPMNLLHPEGHAAAAAMLTEATIGYRRLFASLTPEAKARVTVHAWRSRAELYRRIASRQRIVD